MVDIAVLGLKFESSDAERGVANLDKLVSASRRAEAAVDSTGATAERSFRKMGESSRATDRIIAVLEREESLLKQVLSALNPLAGGFDRLDASLGRLGTDMPGLRTQMASATAVMEKQAAAAEALAASHERLAQAVMGGVENVPARLPGRMPQEDRPSPAPSNSRKMPWGLSERDPASAIGIPYIRQATEAFEAQRREADNVTRSLGLQRHEWINLSRQMQDVVTMGAMGASPGMILSSQGAQIFDIFSSAQAGPAAALKAVAPYAAAVGGLAVTFGIAGKAAFDYARGQDEVERSLRGIGRLSGSTVADINQIAEASAGSARVSVATAREMGAAFAATGRIGREHFGELSIVAARMGKTLGIDASEATARLARAFGGDIMKGALSLNEQLGFLSGRTAELIERQVAMGDRTGAIRTATEALKTSLVGVTEHTNAWAAAWDAVARAALKAYDNSGKAVMAVVAPTPQQQLGSLTQRYLAAQAGALASGNANASLPGDPGHIRFMRGAGYTDAQIQAELNPVQPGSSAAAAMNDAAKAAEKLSDELSYLQEDIRRQGAAGMSQYRQAYVAEKTLAAKGVIDQMAPSNADLLRLTQYKTTLEEALATGQAPSGTRDMLAQVNRLLKDGGTEAHNYREAARDALSVASLLPYQRGLTEIENQFRRLIAQATDPRVIAGLNAAKEDAKRAFVVQNTDNVQRDYRMHLGEMERSYAFQRDSFGQPDQVVETMRAKTEMLSEAMRGGQTVTERYGAGWETLAAQMGHAKAATDELARAQQNVIQGLDEMRSGSRGALTGLFSDLRQGKDPRQGLLSAANRMADQYFDRMISRPFVEGMMGRDGTGQGGWLSGLFGQGGGLPGLMGANGQTGSGCIGEVSSLTFGNDNAEPAEIAA